jgi:hypothetical protein
VTNRGSAEEASTNRRELKANPIERRHGLMSAISEA